MRAIQRVKKLLKNINPLIRNYVIALILAKGRKNCAAMAHSLKISDKCLYPFFSEAKTVSNEIDEILLQLSKKSFKNSTKRALAADPTHILKPYAKYIEKLCYDRAGTTKRTERCLVPIYAMIIDKYATIPLSLKFWMQEKFTGKRLYKSKAQLTQELIIEARNNGVQFDFVPLDGGFAVPTMFDFFAESKESFEMRMPRNRKITTSDGVSAQLQYHPTLKLHRNEREKTAQAICQGRTYYFTAYKRKSDDGEYETVYLVSNMNLTAKEHVAAYDMRWPLEKVIRTTKQKFGAMQCQALEVEKQHAHILAGFLAYAILEIANNDKELKSVDEFVNLIRDLYSDDLIGLIEKPRISMPNQSIELVAKPLENLPCQNSQIAYIVATLNA